MAKFYNSSLEAIEDLKDGASIMIGGFGLCGIPENLLRALENKKTGNLKIISNTAHTDKFGLGPIFKNKQIKSMITSYLGENPIASDQYFNDEIDVTLTPQGTIAETIRANAAGIPAFYVATGVGTEVAEGKEIRVFNGKEYILEKALGADYAFIKAWKADTEGNLIYRKTAKNFNPVMATSGKITIVEVEEIVEAGELDPDYITTPSIYIQRVVRGEYFDKPIEFLTTSD